MITVRYFASLREALDTSGERLDLPCGVATVARLRDLLASRGEPWPALQSVKNLRAAVNLNLVPLDTTVKDGDEVAFFPPVTGG